jgi:hypothetical protein
MLSEDMNSQYLANVNCLHARTTYYNNNPKGAKYRDPQRERIFLFNN